VNIDYQAFKELHDGAYLAGVHAGIRETVAEMERQMPATFAVYLEKGIEIAIAAATKAKARSRTKTKATKEKSKATPPLYPSKREFKPFKPVVLETAYLSNGQPYRRVKKSDVA
jgi:hypothetical protein